MATTAAWLSIISSSDGPGAFRNVRRCHGNVSSSTRGELKPEPFPPHANADADATAVAAAAAAATVFSFYLNASPCQRLNACAAVSDLPLRPLNLTFIGSSSTHNAHPLHSAFHLIRFANPL